ncbi:pentatricopeptide repeat-containing protein [Tanacetum coccineum]
MGNYVSSCTFIFTPKLKTNKAARVIFPMGVIRQFQDTINAAEIMLYCPNYFLVNSQSLNLNRRFTPLSADENLELRQVYIMFPMRRVNSMITPAADMAVFWMSANNAPKRISGKISPDSLSGSDVTLMVPEEQPRLVVGDVPEFSHWLMVCRSKTPVLDTIKEEPVTMPRKTAEDHQNTKSCILKISHEYTSPLKEMLKNLESRCIHEGRVVFQDFDDLVYVESIFSHIGFDCLLKINEQICPRFIFEFYSQYRVNYTLEGQILIEFVIQNQFFSFTIEEFGQILGIPTNGACSFTDKWSLDDLQYGVPTSGPYQTNPPCPDEIKNYVQEEREGPITRIRHKNVIPVEENEILTREIVTIMKSWVEIIRENVFCVGGNRDHVPACLCHMLYCIASHGVLDDYYDLHDRVMYPLTAQQERKTRKDYGTKRGRHSTSSSSAFSQPSSSHLNNDDNDGNDEGTSYHLHSLHHLHNYLLHFSSTSMDSTQASSSNPSKKIKLTIIPHRQLFVEISSDEDNTTTPSPITKSSSPSPPNAPSKTPSTKDTSSTFGTTSSSFELKPQFSPPSSNDSPSPQPSNLFLDNIIDAPPRHSNPIPLQSHPSLDITLSLSPIIPLDHLLDTPLPQPPRQPPLMGHLIYFNTFDYHGVNCLCCFHNRNLIFSLRDEMNLMFAHIEYLLTSAIASPSPPHP